MQAALFHGVRTIGWELDENKVEKGVSAIVRFGADVVNNFTACE